MKKLGLLVPCLLVAASYASSAKADPRTHDGFFLRLGANLGAGFTTESYEFNGQEAAPDLSISGFMYGFDLMLGGSPVPGLVVGGWLITNFGPNPSLEQAGVEAEADGTLIVGGIGAFVNYYFDPTSGFNLQGLVGYGAMDFVRPNGASGGNDPTGPMFGLGAGYDFWISDEWSIGPFARVLFGSYTAEASSPVGNSSATETHLFPSIGAAFTLH